MAGNSDLRRSMRIPRNLLAVSLGSLFTDISSEMIFHLLPLFLTNVLGAKTSVVGLIEGVAESTASLTRLLSGWLSDKLGKRKALTVFGYSLSAVVKPFFLLAGSWPAVLFLRFADRIGKGIRTAPRDALVADSVRAENRGFGFGLHRAADTLGAAIGLAAAAAVAYAAGPSEAVLQADTFRLAIWISILPAFLGVLSLILIARDVPVGPRTPAAPGQLPAAPSPRRTFSPRLIGFFLVVSLFTLGNSSDSFLVLRAQDRGLSVFQVLLAVFVFNAVYTLASAPAGSRSDAVGRGKVLVIGWLVYALVYLGFAAAGASWQIWILYALYGLYYAMVEGTARAYVADLTVPETRGTAYGIFNAAVGIMAFPASLIAGILWQGISTWQGFGASAPFYFGSAMAIVAVVLTVFWLPRLAKE
ncbi:MAG: MFS transporter [Anaerolineales bacterium]|nr:MFS transporter [Anaerolineales bacterium]